MSTARLLDVLTSTTFGQRVAEDEGEALAAYFVETDHWQRLVNDAVDVVYGAKGSGKSALYSLLVARRNDLFDRCVLLAPAENPRGTTAFRSLATDPPTSEREFIALWKLYLLSLIADVIAQYDIKCSEADELLRLLQQSGLREKPTGLQAILQGAREYVKALLRPKALETTVELDPVSSSPSGVSFRILFEEPTLHQAKMGYASIDRLYELADAALRYAGFKTWVILDRLDVAFIESPELEENALRSLFHVYLDLRALDTVRLKIFLRSDIWRRITARGFREASHITRHLTIEWNEATLLNLLVRRIAQNNVIMEYYGTRKDGVLASTSSQEQFFDQVFPDKVEGGSGRPRAFDWMLTRTKDGTRKNAPRELIHLLNSLRDVQVRRLELGDPEPDGRKLFSRAAFKEALPEVSRARLEQTLYAEYPAERTFIESLRGHKSQQSVSSLARLWETTPEEAALRAKKLLEIGFFEERGTDEDPDFWVPFIYREALDLVQGTAAS